MRRGGGEGDHRNPRNGHDAIKREIQPEQNRRRDPVGGVGTAIGGRGAEMSTEQEGKRKAPDALR